jgi:ABC-type lipoprotein release transport system permease subunit
LAWKNLSRYRERTLLTAISIAAGIGFYIFMDAWILGANNNSERNLVALETSWAQVMDHDYFEERELAPLKHTIPDPSGVRAWLEERDVVSTPRVTFTAELFAYPDPFAEYGELVVQPTAIDVMTDDDVFALREHVVDGRYLEADENGVLMGSWMAGDLGAEVGYPILLRTRTKYGAIQTIDVEIVGIVETPNPYVNKGGLFIPLSTADLYLQMEGEVTEIDTRLSSRDVAPEVADRLSQEMAEVFPQLGVYDWKEIAASHTSLLASKSMAAPVFATLILVIAAVGVTNTMLMAVYERIREIGMMRAMGFSDREVRRLLIFESAGIGAIGAAIGLLLGLSMTFWIVNWGLDITVITGDMDIGYRLSGTMKGQWNPGTIVFASVFAVFASMLISVIPVRKALRMQITECLRHT